MMSSASGSNIGVSRKSKLKVTVEGMSGLSLEEYDLLGDSKYRAYVAAVDKTLRNFENTSEWADLISTLGKLNKALLSHMKYPVVPRRITISKRLAQCMHPALPSGVHLKALETYDIIFKCMGTNRLSQELFIYSAGLFPLFSSAAMNVRSALLTVYETHFVPLGPRLRPGLNGFLSGILAGLEEGSDHLERTSQLLSRVAEGVGQAEFFGCLWDCVWGNSGVRLPGITHIMSSYNRKLSTEDQLYILGTNIDVMVAALCQAMEDSSVMVQRAALDLTLAALPMHNTQLLRHDLVRIVTSAILVLLRRDMSLNRRLYAWLLGSEINLSLLSSEHPIIKRLNSAVSDSTVDDGVEVNAYFESFSRPLLVEGIVACLRTSQGKNPPDLRPYRLIVSLLDKPEIGPYILDNIFLDLLRCLYHTCQVLKKTSDPVSEPSSRRQSTTEKQSPSLPQSPDATAKPPGDELVMLAQSELSVWRRTGTLDAGGGEAGVVTVNITPLLLPAHTHILLHHTSVYQHVASQLWTYLEASLSQFHVSSTELLLQLHSLTLPSSCSATLTSASPQSPTSVVERQMLLALTRQLPTCSLKNENGVLWSHGGVRAECDSAAMLQWMTFWQVSRTVALGASGKKPGFDRCLFLMVERLQGSSGSERSLAHAWLTSSLQRNDMGRLIDPILVLLLHPHTRRVSVQHVNIEKLPPPQQGQGNKCVFEESQIYAISSEGGEVVYHVSKEGRQPHSKSRQAIASNKHILALTSLSGDNKKIVTHHANFTEFELPSSCSQPQRQSPISVMVNPFTQHPWIDMEDIAKMNKPSNISNAIRIQNGSYQKSSTTVLLEEVKRNSLIGVEEEASDVEEWTSNQMVQGILEDIVDAVVSTHFRDPESDGSSEQDTISQSVVSDVTSEQSRHPFHSHMLLYMQIVDSGQCLNGLSLLRNIIEAQPKLSLLTLASTSISSLQSASPLIILLARHRRSVFGDGFDGGNANDMVSQFRSTMYLQVVITVCLYYLRSYYPCLPHLRLRDEHLRDNQEVQVASSEVLSLVFSHLSSVVTDSPRGFIPYITDLLSKCKVQKCVLHCLLSTVHAINGNNTASQEPRTFTEEILDYNSGLPSQSCNIARLETYLARVIDLTLALIRLEDILAADRAESGVVKDPPSVSMKYSGINSAKYQPGQPIPAQPMFMEVVTAALGHHHMRHLHGAWLHLFTASLPHMGPSLPSNSLRVTSLICELLEHMASYYKPGTQAPQTPPDYTLTLLQYLTTTVHFCLLDAAQSPAFGSSSYSPSSTTPAGQTAGQILYNLLHVFSPVGEILDAPVDNSNLDPQACARHTLLCHLPRIISALLSLWVATGETQEGTSIMGSRKGVRQQIVELLSPICHHQTPHLLAAVSVVWQSIGIAAADALNTKNSSSNNGIHMKQSSVGGLLWAGCVQQLALVEMMSLLRVLPLHTLVATVRQVVKQPPIVEGSQQTLPLEVSVLQVFYVYAQQCPGSQLGECWASLLSMVKEGTLTLSPPAQLVLLATLNEFVQRAPQLQEKKDVKELQEVSSKLLESCSNIAGSGLEPTTWLRRNLTVKTENPEKKEGVNDASVYSVAALSVLAELLAPLLDVLYVSEEKDKVVPLLTNIMAHVVPYLRNHMRSNMPAFAACSQLLSSLAGYQYTVRAWRRDVLDLLLDTHTFMMLPPILTYWRTIVDYLCTHDKSVFKELLSRVSLSQGGSLSLFSSKESEYETRAGLLKRLAFTIFCSETDQYMRHIPDIQERLAEVTRLGQVVPLLVSQVLLCFRVLLLRLSPRGVTSLWPVIITELVQVFLMMEQELATDSEQFSKKGGSSHLKRLSTLDSSWVFSTQNGLNAHNHPAWLTLYLAACKLLDLMLALPAQHLPQFQMYRWAFVGPIPTSNAEEMEGAGTILLKSCDFVPHIARIAKLMANKTGPKNNRVLEYRPGHLMLTVTSINTLNDLQPFFNTLVSPCFAPAGASVNQPHSSSFPSAAAPSGSGQTSSAASSLSCTSTPSTFSLAHIEAVIERDFLEPLPS
ncbi:protein dopey-1 homolog isoform X4 [Eriocheir sinensis]|uniref:protein dopey-1 homolog isoform X4 n=1 Tax=Eriocheir sinensis TaxID=95602 RepID=UPI0021C59299|nr:protein dopey-1 homolog isoform X4 [Eriocheir sinensis]